MYTKIIQEKIQQKQLKENKKKELTIIVNNLINKEKLKRKDINEILWTDNASLWRIIQGVHSMSLKKVEEYLNKLIDKK